MTGSNDVLMCGALAHAAMQGGLVVESSGAYGPGDHELAPNDLVMRAPGLLRSAYRVTVEMLPDTDEAGWSGSDA